MVNVQHKVLVQVLRTVPSMEQSILILNVSFAVVFHNGSAGVILTFVNLVIRGRMRVTMCQGMKGIGYQSVLDLRNVH